MSHNIAHIPLDFPRPARAVADRCGHDPAVLFRNHAKRTRKADTMANAVIAALTKDLLGNG